MRIPKLVSSSAEKNGISAAEQKRREKAVAFAYDSSALEGVHPSSELLAKGKLFIEGKIDLAEFLAAKENIAIA